MLSRFHPVPERNGCTDGRTDGQTDGQTDGRTDITVVIECCTDNAGFVFVEFYLYPTVSTALIQSVKHELTE